MQTYNYVDTNGKMQSVQADTISSAQKLATNRDPQSGFQLVPTTPAQAPSASANSSTNTSMGAISVDQLANKQGTMNLPQPSPYNANGDVNTTKNASDYIADTFSSVNKEYQDFQAKQKADAESISASMNKLLSKTADSQQANETAGVNTATEEYNKYITQLAELNGQATALSREAQAIPLKLQDQVAGQGVTDAGLAPIQAGELRKNAIKALTLAQNADIVSAAATGSLNKLNLAKEKAQQIIDLKYKPIEDEIAIRTKQYELNKDILAGIDKKRTEALGLALEKEKTILEAKKQLETQLSQIQIEAAKNGAPSDAVARIGSAKNINEAINTARTYLSTPNTEIVKLRDSTAYLIDKRTGKVMQTFGGGGSGYGISGGGTGTINVGGSTSSPSGADYAGIVDTILASGKFTKDQSATIRRAIAQGEDPVTVIKNQARSLLTASNQGDLENAESALDSMKALEKSLADFYQAGGKSSLLKGKYEDVINSLGEVSDPKLAGLAVRIKLDLQEYRKAISGTAFGVQEGADIASVFPQIKNGKILNDVIVKERIAKLENMVDSKYKTVIGEKGLDLIKGGRQVTQNVTTQKGTLSDRDYVEKSLSSRGLKYDTVINSVLDSAKGAGAKQPVPVINNSTGAIGWIEYSQWLNEKSQWTTL